MFSHRAQDELCKLLTRIVLYTWAKMRPCAQDTRILGRMSVRHELRAIDNTQRLKICRRPRGELTNGFVFALVFVPTTIAALPIHRDFSTPCASYPKETHRSWCECLSFELYTARPVSSIIKSDKSVATPNLPTYLFKDHFDADSSIRRVRNSHTIIAAGRKTDLDYFKPLVSYY